MLHSKRNLIVIIGLVVVTLVFIFFFNALVLQKKAPALENSKPETVTASPDPVLALKDSNVSFKNGTELVRKGEFEAALSLLNEAREQSQNSVERSVIDFVIGDTTFEINRSEGLRLLSAVAKNPEYSERTRALAMLRAFLMYFKFSDEVLLRQLSVEHDIPWTIPEEVSYQYMKKLDALYPFAFARIWMIEYELNTIRDGPVAKQLYESSKQAIESNIEDLENWSGEVVELTSTMGAHARLLSRLSLEYDAVSTEEVSRAFETLIDFDDARDLTVNKQYTLIYYADFLSGIGDFDKASKMLRLVLDEGLHPALAESLPRFDRSVKLPRLEVLRENSADQIVIDFISSIGTGLD